MKKSRMILFLAVLAMSLGAMYTFGQAPAAAATNAPAQAGAVPDKQWDTLYGMWVVGGPVMWPIGAVSVLALGLTIYGYMMIRPDKMIRPDLVPKLQDALGKLNVEEALTICNGNPCMMTNVLGAGLQRVSEGVLDVASMEKAMEEASIEETNDGMKPLNNLSVSSQIAPMLGLLGTVTGMIGAFNKIGMGGMGDPEKLAGDIGEAMITTAFGLIVAIPAMFAYFHLKGQFIANTAKVGRVIGNLTHHLVVSTREGGSAAPAEGGAAQS